MSDFTIECCATPSLEEKLGVSLDTEEISLRLNAKVNADMFAHKLGITDEKEINRLYHRTLYIMRKRSKKSD